MYSSKGKYAMAFVLGAAVSLMARPHVNNLSQKLYNSRYKFQDNLDDMKRQMRRFKRTFSRKY